MITPFEKALIELTGSTQEYELIDGKINFKNPEIKLTYKDVLDRANSILKKEISLEKIIELEKKTYRPLREISLGIETEYNVSKLEKINAEIQELRTQL